MRESSSIRISGVHLKVHDLQRAILFYVRHLNLRVVERLDAAYAFLSSPDEPDTCVLTLQAVGSQAPAPDEFTTGLYHIAFALADRQTFAATHKRLCADGVAVEAVDHGSQWALYCRDPDGNGLKLYWAVPDPPSGSVPWPVHARLLPPERLDSET